MKISWLDWIVDSIVGFLRPLPQFYTQTELPLSEDVEAQLSRWRIRTSHALDYESPLVSQKQIRMVTLNEFGPRKTKVIIFTPSQNVEQEEEVKSHAVSTIESRPLIFLIRGGGFHQGRIDAYVYRCICERIALDLDAQVCALEYCHAPENPFPAPYKDVVETAEYILDEMEKLRNSSNLQKEKEGKGQSKMDESDESFSKDFDFDPSRVLVCGVSAGACLGSLLALKLQKRCIGQVLLIPYVAVHNTDSRKEFATTSVGWKEKESVFGWKCYLGTQLHAETLKKVGEEESTIDERISPLYVSDAVMKDVSKAWIGIGAFDVERDGGRLLADKYRKVGKLEELKEYPTGHVSLSYQKTQVADAITALRQFLK